MNGINALHFLIWCMMYGVLETTTIFFVIILFTIVVNGEW